MAVELNPNEVEQLRSKVFLAAKYNKPDVIRVCLASLHPDVIKDVLHHRSSHQFSETTPLHIDAIEGHVGVVELLVNEFNVGISHEVYFSQEVHNALQYAAFRGNLIIVKVLVMMGCNISSPGEDGLTPACVACDGGHLDVLKYLVENGADINDHSSMGDVTCLMIASLHGHHSLVEYLLSVGANPNERDECDRTALHWAVINNASDIIALLLNHGAELSRDENGHSPLITAVLHCTSESVHAFLESKEVSQAEKIDALELLGAIQAATNTNEAVRHMTQAMEERYKNPDAVLLKPHSPLPTLSNVQESQTLEELRARQADQHLFCLECLAAVTRILGPADPSTMKIFNNYFDELRRRGQHREATAVLLHSMRNDAEFAAKHQHYFINQFSINFAQMIQKGLFGFFPDVVEVLEMILTTIKKIDRKNDYIITSRNQTWLHCLLVGLVVARGQEEGKRLQKMAELFIQYLPNSTLLHEALRCLRYIPKAFKNLIDLAYDLLISFLLQCGADVNFKDFEKNTALHIVALISQKEEHSDLLSRMTKVLVQAGALVGVQNREGKTPLGLAGPALAAELRELYPVSLRSLAATAVVNSRILYTSETPKDLEEFVDKH